MGPFYVTRSNRTHQLTDPTQPNSTHYSWKNLDPTRPTQSQVSSDAELILVLIVSQPSTYSCSSLIAIHILVLLLQWTQPNPTHGSTQPMDNCGPAGIN